MIYMILSIASVLVVPGPTNTLLLISGTTRGVRRSVHMIGVELIGYCIAISIWGTYLNIASASNPWIPHVVKFLCAVYIGYLALKFWRETVPALETIPRTARPVDLFFATLLNPKGLIFASVIFPPSTFTELKGFAQSLSLFACLAIPIGMGWICLGASLASSKYAWLHPRALHRGAAVVLSIFCALLGWNVVHGFLLWT
ncbi:MAG: LysE family transporter [Pseudomonadota bacterium]